MLNNLREAAVFPKNVLTDRDPFIEIWRGKKTGFSSFLEYRIDANAIVLPGRHYSLIYVSQNVHYTIFNPNYSWHYSNIKRIDCRDPPITYIVE